MEKEERLTVRLSSDDFALLTYLVSHGEFESESDALVKALETFLTSRFSHEEREEVLKKARAFSAHDLNEFVSDGKDAGDVLGHVLSQCSERNGEE